ncbi:MAG: hypothetical protein JNN07_23685 [Verrucomicrobiales bacterium]|nr:hypothetical protein [Verrucomicrobiales bacterium]
MSKTKRRRYTGAFKVRLPSPSRRSIVLPSYFELSTGLVSNLPERFA